jgi:hypothetical protein
MIPSNQRLGAVEGVASGATDRNSRSFFFRGMKEGEHGKPSGAERSAENQTQQEGKNA